MRLIPKITFRWQGWGTCLVGFVCSRNILDLFLEIFVGRLWITLAWPNGRKRFEKIRRRERAKKKASE